MMFGTDRTVESRLVRVERKLDLIMRHLGIEEDDSELAQVRALVDEGRTMEAIKVHRETTGASLKEAKDVVDAIKAGRR
ncbi:hypothetical protein ACWGR4_26015 [Embleya sp. NPDC055664]|uniref:hypothetical protein n=1 Tax=Embleya sp. NPDC059237 TaxID=3346784 RepID=UPI00369D6842